MHSSDKNISSYYDINSTGHYNFKNKKNFLSFINGNNFSPNRYKLLNSIEKKDFINPINSNLNNIININKKQKTNSILNQLLINQTKQEKIHLNRRNDDLSFNSNNTTTSKLDNIFLEQIKNKEKNENFFHKSYNLNNNNNENLNNINNAQNNNINEKANKINYALESHQLINSLLKNQNKNSDKKFYLENRRK